MSLALKLYVHVNLNLVSEVNFLTLYDKVNLACEVNLYLNILTQCNEVLN